MLKKVTFFLLSLPILLIVVSSSKSEDYRSSVITDPSISRRCRELTQERTKKISHRQKITALIVRNKKLQKNAPSNKKKALNILAKNLKRLKNELSLTLKKIQLQEENLVRRGCPGIKL